MSMPGSEYAFDKDLTARLRGLTGPAPRGLQRWSAGKIFCLLVFAQIIFFLLFAVPNRFFEPGVMHITVVLATLGIWRFGWWFTHAVRAEIYRRLRWPGMRAEAEAVWKSGWRPRRLHIQMTTYYEEPAITKRVIGSILGQIRREQIPTTIYVGTGSAYDELIIRSFMETHAQDIPDDLAELVFLRQNQPGKRMAIGMILRSINRNGVDPDDLVIFMDGDALFGNDVLEKTLSMFGADPELQALTTDEEVICYGPKWIGAWLNMRFAQRRLAMQSHALSGKVLTLTGRMSVFRAQHMRSERFIRTIEADHLDHWLWGRFRFLSGDDKSTWYHMLTCGAKMTYVPDATVYTIEVIKENGLERMVQNFRRWSGNMLRNGSRAIALGPRKVNPFIWWCVVDQRIAMWTMMVSPTLAILAALQDPFYLWSCLIWVAFSRLVLCLFLFRYSREVDLSWPFILYLNQVINASVKIFMIFHLSKQKWSNRGNQTAGSAMGWVARLQSAIAKAQLVVSVSTFITVLAMYIGLLPTPI
ncbi:glycosyltransferase [Hoeflea prorocentri]|uniref:Glycosyltransferase n=1 Tax=Hoeflea prorocentri TaxID=1922333 RepID=A0A9X3ZFY7_9HYPH|nr:glycosyltransferase [Hoeflea prorocentri]MCY6379634.1 glycosyltransferase [Hoeflea prorocentri]MDA5397434.1 glycosyltransferase [Hoeflea prorocentri]